MKILFTKSDNFGSFLIRWGTSDDMWGLSRTSHVAVSFDNKIIHSTHEKGVHATSREKFSKTHELVAEYELIPVLATGVDALVYDELFEGKLGLQYDMGSIIYFAYRSLLRKFGDKPYPITNKWNMRDMLFCVEVVECIDKYYKKSLHIDLFPKRDALNMVYPEMLLKMVENSEYFKRV